MKPGHSLFAFVALVLGSSPTGRAPREVPELLLITPEPPFVPLAPALAEPPAPVAWAEALAPLRFVDTHHGASDTVRLYSPSGSLDESAACAVDRVLAEPGAEPRPLNRRTLQLVVKAAAHFKAIEVDVVSSYRDSARSKSRHRSGEAIDFRLLGVTAAALAAYMRSYARAGVGVYTNRRTQFVHLDVRDESFHWIDASPPGRSWRESRLSDRGGPARDAAYRPEDDLPEAARRAPLK